MSAQRTPTFMTGIALLLPITLSTMAIVLLAPILPMLLAEFSHVPNHEYWVPMILTVPALCVALFSPLAGIAGDYFGRRRLLMASFVAYAALGVAPVFLSSLPAILISRVGVGMAEAVIMVMTTTLIGDIFTGARRDRWLSAQTAFASLSALVFFNLGGQLGAYGWRTPFWVYLSALAMLALVVAFTWEPGSAGESGSSRDTAPRNASWTGFPWVRMGGIILITIYGSVFFYTVQIQASVGLDLLGESNPARIGFLTSLASIGVPLGTVIYGMLTGRAQVASLLTAEFALLAAGFTLMGRAEATMPFLVGCFVNQLGAGMLLPTLLVWAMNLLPYDIRSRGAGMWTGAFSIGQFLSPLAVTALGQAAGGLMGAFRWLAVLALAGALLALLAGLRRAKAGVEQAAHG